MGYFDFKVDLEADVFRDESGKISDVKVGDKSILKELTQDEIKEAQEHMDSEDHSMEMNPMKYELFDIEVEVEYSFSKGIKSNDYLQPDDPDEVEIESVSFGNVDIKDGLSDYYLSKIDDKAVDEGNDGYDEEEWEPDMDESKEINESSGDVELYAQPYDSSAEGFYFKSKKEFDEKFEKNKPVEEYEIQFIDGSKEDADLFDVIQKMIGQSEMDEYFDNIVPLEDEQKAALYHLVGIGEDLGKALQIVKKQDYSLSKGTIEDYAYDILRDTYSEIMDGPLGNYIDIDAFARDMELNGEVSSFTFGGEKYVISGYN